MPAWSPLPHESRPSARGFTLVEILVALAIFMLITGIAAVSYQSANRRSRDARRQADLEEVRTKLEIWRADNPATGYPAGDWTAMTATLVPAYLTVAPQDPRPTLYWYYYNGTATAYSLCAYMETGGTSPCTVVGGICGTPSIPCNWCTCNP